jgi:hydrogenase maturation protease
VRVVGCGNRDAGDDAVGLIIAEQLRGRLPSGFDVRTETGGGAGLIRWCEDIETLILVDAALATEDFPAGQWRRLAYPADREQLGAMALSGSHLLGLAQGLELALALGTLPGEVQIHAMAGAQFELGAGLSPAVERALAAWANDLERAILPEPDCPVT